MCSFVTVGLFYFVSYLFSSSSSADVLVSSKLVSVVTVKEDHIEIEYASTVSKKKKELSLLEMIRASFLKI